MSRESLGKESIVDAAMELADRNGVEKISMRKLASELGVQAMSLYNHVRNKEAILDELVERVVGEIELPNPALPWRTAMRRRALSAHAVLLDHPWAIMVLMTRKSAGPRMLRYVDATLGSLVEAGFSYEEADRIWNAMDSYIYGYTLQETSFPFQQSEYAETAAEFMPQVDAAALPYFTALATSVMKQEYSGVHEIEFGLDLILDGLERR